MLEGQRERVEGGEGGRVNGFMRVCWFRDGSTAAGRRGTRVPLFDSYLLFFR
jgi:hypothetical protein